MVSTSGGQAPGAAVQTPLSAMPMAAPVPRISAGKAADRSRPARQVQHRLSVGLRQAGERFGAANLDRLIDWRLRSLFACT
jgi:hypothetical protein